MADVTLTVDGKKLTVPAGTLLIEACKSTGIEVPSFCYYPNLSLQGACRMCLVEIEKMPKLQTACTTPVAEGMVVATETDKIKQARKSMLELLLANHPLDCPVCDAGGECELQDMTFKYGAAESKFIDLKNHRDEQQWSPVVFFDRPRCILCYRCVRACGEGMDVWALGVQNRGSGSIIAPNHGDHLECEECGMCIDICPVGALTSGAYRYKTRPWEMKHVGTVCTHCGDGCKTTLGVRRADTGMQIVRGDNRDKSGINGDFLCVKGRYAFDFANNPDRLQQPLIKRDGKFVTSTWEQAFDLIATKFQQVLTSDGPSAVGVIGSNHTSNEESYLLQKFARLVLGTNNIDHHRTADFPAFASALAAKPDATASMRDVATAPAILLIGNDPTDQHPLLAWQIRSNVRLHRAKVYIANSASIKLRRQATAYAQIAPGSRRLVRAIPRRQRRSGGLCGLAQPDPRVADSAARRAEEREGTGHHLRLGAARRRRQDAGRFRTRTGREVYLPGRLRQLARRRRHGSLSRHAAGLRSGGQRHQVPRRVAGRDSEDARHEPAADDGRSERRQAEGSLRRRIESGRALQHRSLRSVEELRHRPRHVPDRDGRHR